MNQLITTFDRPNRALKAIAESELADSSKRKYTAAILAYIDNGRRSLTSRSQLRAYSHSLNRSAKGFLKAAVTLWAKEMIEQVRATPATTPDEVSMKQEAMWRFETVRNAITTKKANGEKVHTWLTQAEVSQLVNATRSTPGAIGQRDELAIALLVGAGLRRQEAVTLKFADVKLQPVKGKLRSVLQVHGKGDKTRPVPISDKLKTMIDKWAARLEENSVILRSVTKDGKIGRTLSAVGLFAIVRKHGRTIGKPLLAPHDLRRSYAQIGYESGIPVTQISKLLGHESLATTQKYLNLALDLETTISDFIPL